MMSLDWWGCWFAAPCWAVLEPEAKGEIRIKISHTFAHIKISLCNLNQVERLIKTLQLKKKNLYVEPYIAQSLCTLLTLIGLLGGSVITIDWKLLCSFHNNVGPTNKYLSLLKILTFCSPWVFMYWLLFLNCYIKIICFEYWVFCL